MGLATPGAHFFAAVILGVWLISSPASFDYQDAGLAISDVVSGTLIITFATITLTRGSSWAPWANTLVGIWLLFAPLVFEAPTAAAFINDWLSGILVISFVLLMPGMPGMRMLPGPDVPPGWSYNPSTWSQRAPIIVLAILNFLLSRYMTTFQLGYIDSIWDPFFSPGTRAVLTSDVSRAFPVSDAGLGALSYIIEGLMGFMGDRARWRTMPWMVWIFGILVVPLGVVSVALIILQPVAVGNWCTVCLIIALFMLIMVALTLDEVVATTLFLVRAKREGQSAWRVFWLGGTLEESTDATSRTRPDVVSPAATVWGTGLPWNLLVGTALGVWLMASPAVLGITGGAANSTSIVGALVATVALIALSEVGRSARFVNVLFGAWFVVMPFILDGSTTASTVSSVAVGVALVALSLPRGKIRETYGEFDRYVV
ncbi:MAG: vitamin K epoxide reductase family protein [Rubrobacteraceae bacterium]